MGKPYLLLSSHFPRAGILLDIYQTEKPLKGAGGWGLEIVHYVTCRPIPALQAGLSFLALSHVPPNTGAVTFPITLVSSSLTSSDCGSPKTGFVCI